MDNGQDGAAAAASADERRTLDRREALRKLAAYSAFTAPVLLAVLHAEQAVAQSSGPPIKGECTVGPPPDCTFS